MSMRYGALAQIHASKALTMLCMAAAVVLIAARADGLINASLWSVFVPLFVWDAAAIVGAAMGLAVLVRLPAYEIEPTDHEDVKNILLTASLFVCKLVFELLVCAKVDGAVMMSWSLVFIPSYVLAVASMAVCVYQKRHERPADVEGAFALLALFFVLLPLKLDGVVDWGWQIVFIPIWIMLAIGTAAVLFFVFVYMGSQPALEDDRSEYIGRLAVLSFVVAMMAVSTGLITARLSGAIDGLYTAMVTPFLAACAVVFWRSIVRSGGNPWWFGLRLHTNRENEFLPVFKEDEGEAQPLNGESSLIDDEKAEPVVTFTPPPPVRSLMVPD